MYVQWCEEDPTVSIEISKAPENYDEYLTKGEFDSLQNITFEWNTSMENDIFQLLIENGLIEELFEKANMIIQADDIKVNQGQVIILEPLSHWTCYLFGEFLVAATVRNVCFEVVSRVTD